jgi:hypothetical protein
MNELLKFGLKGTKIAVQCGDDNYYVKHVDLLNRTVRLIKAMAHERFDYEAFNKPWFRVEDFGIIACNGCLGKLRAKFTRDGLVNYLNQLARQFHVQELPTGILSIASGKPILASENHAFVLSGGNKIMLSNQRRIHAVTIDPIHLSKFGYYMASTLVEFIALIKDNEGILCDPFAIRASKKNPYLKYLEIPF